MSEQCEQLEFNLFEPTKVVEKSEKNEKMQKCDRECNIEVGDSCILMPLDKNREFYEDFFPQLLGRECIVTRIESSHANAQKVAAWIKRGKVETIAYVTDLVKKT